MRDVPRVQRARVAGVRFYINQICRGSLSGHLRQSLHRVALACQHLGRSTGGRLCTRGGFSRLAMTCATSMPFISQLRFKCLQFGAPAHDLSRLGTPARINGTAWFQFAVHVQEGLDFSYLAEKGRKSPSSVQASTYTYNVLFLYMNLYRYMYSIRYTTYISQTKFSMLQKV